MTSATAAQGRVASTPAPGETRTIRIKDALTSQMISIGRRNPTQWQSGLVTGQGVTGSPLPGAIWTACRGRVTKPSPTADAAGSRLHQPILPHVYTGFEGYDGI